MHRHELHGQWQRHSSSTQGIEARGALISGCHISNNQGYGIYVPTNGSRIVGNLIFSNSSTGILVTAATGGNVIDGNTVASNSGPGINLTTAGNLSVRNIAHGNSSANFSAVAGNTNAQVITGGQNFVTTDPNANISYLSAQDDKLVEDLKRLELDLVNLRQADSTFFVRENRRRTRLDCNTSQMDCRTRYGMAIRHHTKGARVIEAEVAVAAR